VALSVPDDKPTVSVCEAALGDQDIAAVLPWMKAQWLATRRQQHDQENAETAKASSP